ncbi:nuclease-related domain-containing protein [Peribacillus loiseleuriae]|uniref:nuclease-related domain-containing protein n=1 Tax=Peribacillus loiseleuriae TaxID=1679170 RepID=UPI003CFC747F
MAITYLGINKNQIKLEKLEKARQQDYEEKLIIYNKKIELLKKKRPYFITVTIICTIVISFINFFFSIVPLIVYFVLSIFVAPSEPYKKYPSNQEEILKSGLEGEKYTLDFLKDRLSADFVIFTNPVALNYEIDFIILGPSGLFIIENKHMRGTFSGNLNAKEWIREKIDDYGEVHKENTRNPYFQVCIHKKKLTRYLRDNNFSQEINEIVFFSDEAEFNINHGTGKPIFDIRLQENLLKYITETKQYITESKQKKLINLLYRITIREDINKVNNVLKI